MVKKDQILDIEITDLSHTGEGIGKAEGYTLFVKDALPEDVVRVKVIKSKKTYGYGRLMEVLKASPYRVEPKCEIARQCGGCQIQHMDYKAQLAHKEKVVKNCLERIGGIDLNKILVEPIIGMEEPYYYRNKAQYPVGMNKEGQIITGFYAGRTHSIIEGSHCHIQAKENEIILKIIKDFMKDNNLQPYQEETQTGLIRHIMTRSGHVTGEIMVCLVIHATDLPQSVKDDLVKRLTAKGLFTNSHISSICLNINMENTNVIMGKTIVPVYKEPYITDYIKDIRYQISPLSFYQVNPIQTVKLYEKALEYAALTQTETVWDLYCGIGTISLFLAKEAKMVYGVEIVEAAVQDAKENAKANNINNVEFFSGKAEEIVPQKYQESQNSMKADVVVVDPPRKGCDQVLLDTLIKMEPKRIVYVSCDPATLARDVKWLGEHGYEVKKVAAVDQFGHTMHVETVVLLSQQRADDRIEVDLELDELDVTSAESKATYAEIKDYVLKEHRLKVSNLYISQVKNARKNTCVRKCGIEVGEKLIDDLHY